MRFLARMFCCRRTRRSNVRPAAPPTVDSYNSSLKLDVDAKDGSVVAAEEVRSRVTTMLGAERGEASVAELLELRKMVDQSTVSSRGALLPFLTWSIVVLTLRPAHSLLASLARHGVVHALPPTLAPSPRQGV